MAHASGVPSLTLLTSLMWFFVSIALRLLLLMWLLGPPLAHLRAPPPTQLLHRLWLLPAVPSRARTRTAAVASPLVLLRRQMRCALPLRALTTWVLVRVWLTSVPYPPMLVLALVALPCPALLVCARCWTFAGVDGRASRWRCAHGRARLTHATAHRTSFRLVWSTRRSSRVLERRHCLLLVPLVGHMLRLCRLLRCSIGAQA